MATNMRGLTQVCWPNLFAYSPHTECISRQFIADIRGARVRELEEKRINKEMANIRKRFKGTLTVIPLPARQSESMRRRKLGWLSKEEVSAYA